MEQTSYIRTIENIFNLTDRSIIASLPADINVNYFVDKKSYSVYVNSMLDKVYPEKYFYPYIFRFSIENFIRFAPNELVNGGGMNDSNYNNNNDLSRVFINFEDFEISKFSLKDVNYFHISDNTFTKDNSNSVVNEYVLSRYYLENLGIYEKFFLLKNNFVEGYLCLFLHEGKFLAEMVNNLTLKQRVWVCRTLAKKLEFLSSLNVDYYDVDLRSTYVLISGGEVSFENIEDFVIINKKANPKYFTDDRSMNNLKHNTNLKYEKCFGNILQALAMCFDLIQDTQSPTKMKFKSDFEFNFKKGFLNFNEKLFTQIEKIINSMEIRQIFKNELIKVMRRVILNEDKTRSNINYLKEVVLIQFILDQILASFDFYDTSIKIQDEEEKGMNNGENVSINVVINQYSEKKDEVEVEKVRSKSRPPILNRVVEEEIEIKNEFKNLIPCYSVNSIKIEPTANPSIQINPQTYNNNKYFKDEFVILQRKEQFIIPNSKVSMALLLLQKSYNITKTSLTLWGEKFRNLLDPTYQINKYFFNNITNEIYEITEEMIMNNSLFIQFSVEKFTKFNQLILCNEINITNNHQYDIDRDSKSPEGELCSPYFTIPASKILYYEDLVRYIETSNVLLKEGESEYNEGNFTKAEEKFSKCLELRVRALGMSNKETAIIYNSLAGVQLKLSRHKEALENYMNALSVYTITVGEGHILIASVLHNIGLIYDLLNNYTKALEYYNWALRIKLSKLGEKNSSTASTYYNIGGIYDIRGDLTEALRYYKITLEIYLAVYSSDHVDIATAYNNLGLVYDKLNRVDESINSYKKSLEISKRLFGDLHPLNATSHNNLGLVYFKINNLNEAIFHFEKSIFIRENLLRIGFVNSDIASTYNNLAGIYYKQGLYDQAYQNYQKCLEANIKLLGEQTSDTATAYNNFGLSCIKLRRYEEALVYFKKSYQIRVALYGDMNRDSLTSLVNIAGVYFKMKDNNLCISYYMKVYNAYLKLYGENSVELINILNNLGHTYNNALELDKSIEYYLKSLEVCVFNFGENSVQTADVYANLSNCYENLEDMDKAREYMMKSVIIKENINYQK